MKTAVVNARDENYDVYIGRGSIWGNPFSHRPSMFDVVRVATREEAITKYEVWLRSQPQLMAKLPKLKGKILGCYCKPLACHGDVLARLADEAP